MYVRIDFIVIDTSHFSENLARVFFIVQVTNFSLHISFINIIQNGSNRRFSEAFASFIDVKIVGLNFFVDRFIASIFFEYTVSVIELKTL